MLILCKIYEGKDCFANVNFHECNHNLSYRGWENCYTVFEFKLPKKVMPVLLSQSIVLHVRMAVLPQKCWSWEISR